MAELSYIDPKYVAVAGDWGQVYRPFTPSLQCRVIHCHSSPRCSVSSRACFLDQEHLTLYCTDRGLKGGGGGASKVRFKPKTGQFWETSEQNRAIERLDQAMNQALPALAYQCCDILFDCENPTILYRAISIITQSFKYSDRVWAWSGTQGHLARIHCARLLRIGAARVMIASQLDENEGPVIMSDDQKSYCQILENSVRRVTEQAKTRREIVLQAELRASWAVISSIKNPRDIREWIKDYGPVLASLGSLVNPLKNPGFTAQAIVANAVMVYDISQKIRDRSLSHQIMLVTCLDFSVSEVTAECIELLKKTVKSCKRWVTAVLCAALVRKWLSTPEKLSKESYDGCLEVLRMLCSFKVFVFRSNWKVRSGALWNVAALHESAKLRDLRSLLLAIIEERKTIEKDVAVLGAVEDMDSFRSAQLYLQTAEVYGSVLQKELADLTAFVKQNKEHLNTIQSEIDSKNYQEIIRKEVEKVLSTFEELSTQHREILNHVLETKTLVNELKAMVAAQLELIKLLKQPQAPASGKIENLPRLSLVTEKFRGRNDELMRLRQCLGDANGSKAVALIGPEGIGKSWLALKYAKTNLDMYDVVAYFQADSASSIYLGLLSLSKDLKNCEKCSDRETLEAVKRHLSETPRVLLIYDNADFRPASQENEAEAAEEYRNLLLLRTQGHTLLTCRTDRWSERERFEVPVFAEQDAIELLHGASIENWTRSQAREVARELECVPLAVNQAASLLQRKKWSSEVFLDSFRERRSTESSLGDTVMAMALDSLTEEGKQLMEMMALLSGFVPLDMVKGLRKNITDTCLMSILSDLRAAGLIDLNQYGLTVNRSFQELAKRHCVQKESRQSAVSNTLTSMGLEAYSNDNLMSSGKYVTSKGGTCPDDPRIAKGVGDRLADLELNGEELCVRKIEAIDAREISAASPETLVDSHIDVGSSYFRSRRIAEGEREFREAEQAAGDCTVLIIKIKSTYGSLLYKLKNNEQAAAELLVAVQLARQHPSLLSLKAEAELYTNCALVEMERKADTQALEFFSLAFELRNREEPRSEKEFVQVIVNFAYFYQTSSSLLNLRKAEELNTLALETISDSKNRQLGVIYRNMSSLYGYYLNQRNMDSAQQTRLIERKMDFHRRHLQFRQQYHAAQTVDQEMSQVYLGIADCYILREEWQRALEYAGQAKTKSDPADGSYSLKLDRKIEALRFRLHQLEVNRQSSNRP